MQPNRFCTKEKTAYYCQSLSEWLSSDVFKENGAHRTPVYAFSCEVMGCGRRAKLSLWVTEGEGRLYPWTTTRLRFCQGSHVDDF